MKIIKKLKVRGTKGESELSVVFNSGAGLTYIRKDVADMIGDLRPLGTPIPVAFADGEEAGMLKEGTVIEILVNDIWIYTAAFVLEKLSHAVIIGATTMESYNMVLEMKDGNVIMRGPRAGDELI